MTQERAGPLPLTDRAYEVLQFFSDHIVDYGYAPSVRQIADHFKWSSPNAAMRYIRRLKEHGLIITPRSSVLALANWPPDRLRKESKRDSAKAGQRATATNRRVARAKNMGR